MIQALLFILFVHIGVDFIGISLSGSQPLVSTAMSAAVTETSATIPVSSIVGFSPSGWLFIEGEAMEYTAVATTCPAPYAAEPDCFTGVTRGLDQTKAAEHSASARVYNETTGLVNNLATFESRTTIDGFGENEGTIAKVRGISNFIFHAVTWDYPMFEGAFAVFRIFGVAFTIALGVGIGIAALRATRPF